MVGKVTGKLVVEACAGGAFLNTEVKEIRRHGDKIASQSYKFLRAHLYLVSPCCLSWHRRCHCLYISFPAFAYI